MLVAIANAIFCLHSGGRLGWESTGASVHKEAGGRLGARQFRGFGTRRENPIFPQCRRGAGAHHVREDTKTTQQPPPNHHSSRKRMPPFLVFLQKS